MTTKGINSTNDIDSCKREINIHCLDVRYNELALKSMMNSCFTYGSIEINSYDYNKYILPYQKELTQQVFKEVYEEQKTYLSNCIIKRGVYTDVEGCSYDELIG